MFLLAYLGYSLQGFNCLESKETKERHKLNNNVTSQNSRVEAKMMIYLDKENVKDQIFTALKDLHIDMADAIALEYLKAGNNHFVPKGHHGI
jgi:hypothetical protein